MQLRTFGPFCLDLAGRQLTRDGAPVPLFPKVFDTLAVLVESGGAVLSKDELMERIWPGTFVQESNLTQNIFLLRKALGGDGDESYIKTVPRRGYRFAAAVTTSAEPLAAARRRPRLRWWMIAAGVLLAAGVFGFSRYAGSASSRMSIDRLTSEGKAYEPAISPDGKLVAYKVIDRGGETIRLRDLTKGSSVQVMPPSAAGYHAVTFSPDGSELYFLSYRTGVKNGLIFRVPIFGGAPQEVAREVWSDFNLSPDGKEVAFLRGPGESQQVVAARTDGSGERVIGRNTSRATSFHMWDSAPVWSPDGLRIALCGIARDAHADRAAVFEMDAHTGAVEEIPTPRWESVEHAAWMPDGDRLLAVAQERGGSPSQIWLVDRVTGRSHRVTNDLSDYGKMNVSADGRQLVVEQHGSEQHMWRIHDGDAQLMKQLTFGPADEDGRSGVSWTGDGRVLFASNRTGEYEIWSMLPDGSDARQLTANSSAPNTYPRATADGRYVVFASGRSGRSRIWRIDADGRNPLELTHGDGDMLPDVSPDSRWVYYSDAAATPSRIMRVPIDGGAAMPLPYAAACDHPVVSPDGRAVVFESYDDVHGWRTGVMPAAGGAARLFDWHAVRGIVCWTADSQGVVFVRKDGNLWLQPVDGGAPRPVTHFAERVWNAAISPDSREFVVVAGAQWSDIVRIRGIR